MVVCLSRVDLHDRPANRGSYSRRYALAPGALPFPCWLPRQASRAGDRLDVVAENRLAVSRSPAITVLMPSRSGALLAIRFRTSSLKLRVSAISWLHSLSSCRRFPPIARSPPTVLSVAQCPAAGAACAAVSMITNASLSRPKQTQTQASNYFRDRAPLAYAFFQIFALPAAARQ